MGYELHITRAENWADNDDCPISLEEWLALVEADPELTIDPANGSPTALWAGPSTYDDPWFNWSEGNVSTKNPDPAMIAKMIEMASRLEAHVQGDDGERYDHPPDI